MGDKNDSFLASISKNVQALMDNLYRSTYYTSNDNKKALDTLRKNIDTSITDLIDNSYSSNGANMSKVYSRVVSSMKNVQNDKQTTENIEKIFSDQGAMDNILSTYMDNKYIRDLDLEIDTICKYMPKLEEALEVKKEGVLSADDFTKEFVTIKSISNTNMDSSSMSANIDEIKKTYKLNDIIETTYDNTSKYGEQFLYVVPYNKAFSLLLNNKDNKNSNFKLSESGIMSEILDGIELTEEEAININKYDLEIIYDKSSTIRTIVTEEYGKVNKKPLIDPDKLQFSEDETVDGLIDAKKNNAKIDVNGCVVRRLKRENVIPLYIDDICLGYYYIESENSNAFEYIESLHDPIAGLKKNNYANKVDDLKKDTVLKQLSAKISKEIDSKFINANQDIRKEIYMILKHNDLYSDNTPKLKVSFIQPEDMIHSYFRKDQKTNRGISDLDRSLLPAKLYSCLYITNTVGVLTRSQDKRAYFVKQHIDTNISGVLLNTINQIKKSNFGMREINNMNNILNITGRYNDYIIPVSQNNEKPIEFEIIPGQEINTRSELMDSLESMAINPTGIPLEFLDSRRSVEFSRQLTMSNGKMARHVLKRQASFQVFISDLITKIYNYHFNTNEILEAMLPPPSHLTITNTIDMLRNSKDLTDGILEIQVHDSDRDADWVPEFKKRLMKYYMGSYVNWSVIDNLEKQARLESATPSKEE